MYTKITKLSYILWYLYLGLGTFQLFLAVPLTGKKVNFQVALNFKFKNGTSVR